MGEEVVLTRGQTEPACRFAVVLRHTPALGVHESQIELGKEVVLIRKAAERLQCGVVVTSLIRGHRVLPRRSCRGRGIPLHVSRPFPIFRRRHGCRSRSRNVPLRVSRLFPAFRRRHGCRAPSRNVPLRVSRLFLAFRSRHRCRNRSRNVPLRVSRLFPAFGRRHGCRSRSRNVPLRVSRPFLAFGRRHGCRATRHSCQGLRRSGRCANQDRHQYCGGYPLSPDGPRGGFFIPLNVRLLTRFNVPMVFRLSPRTHQLFPGFHNRHGIHPFLNAYGHTGSQRTALYKPLREIPTLLQCRDAVMKRERDRAGSAREAETDPVCRMAGFPRTTRLKGRQTRHRGVRRRS